MMSREELKAILSSLGRIELLIKTDMQARYGEKEADRVYQEAVRLIDNAFKEFEEKYEKDN